MDVETTLCASWVFIKKPNHNSLCKKIKKKVEVRDIAKNKKFRNSDSNPAVLNSASLSNTVVKSSNVNRLKVKTKFVILEFSYSNSYCSSLRRKKYTGFELAFYDSV